MKVIVGTRRFHDPGCPLVRNVDEGGLDTMSREDAEAAGMTGCSVCQSPA